ncbi:hypothetical protein [Cellulomonas sp. S1-8]|uniref:hypothetical protein n=1 Tax=Cellulomonas sp. S1-8 TaxID=2904790 RepID=UPI002243DB35|nr:hypothetical protein [Cellulomonas sp. S1-8]UZN02758.1 hypothetical protein OKX07_17130 [Cellulomonas sp. S1-8]
MIDAYDAFWRRIRRLIGGGLLSAVFTLALIWVVVGLNEWSAHRAAPDQSVTLLVPAPSSDRVIAALSFLVVLSIALQVAVSADRAARPAAPHTAPDVELAGRTLLLQNVARAMVFLSWLTALVAVGPHLADAPRVLDVAGVGGPILGALLVSFFAADAAELASDPDAVTLRARARRQVRLERLVAAVRSLAARRASSTVEHVQDALLLTAPMAVVGTAWAMGWTTPSAAVSALVLLSGGIAMFTLAAYMAATRESLGLAALASLWGILSVVLWIWAFFSAWAALDVPDERVAGALAAVAAGAVVLGTSACLTLAVVSRPATGRRPLLRGAALGLVVLDLRSVRSDRDRWSRRSGAAEPVVRSGLHAAWPWGWLASDLHPVRGAHVGAEQDRPPVHRGGRTWPWTVPVALLVGLPVLVYLVG